MTPPNLVFLYTDEQSAATLAAYGNDAIAMPNLNRLAARSAVFERAYVTQPVCTPSRASLLTGLYPHTHRCEQNNQALSLETPCLPDLLPPGVYATGHFGKWHLGDELFPQHGFTDWAGIDDGYTKHNRPWRPKGVKSGYHHFLTEHGKRPANGDVFGRGEVARLPEELSKPAYLAREASRFIREHRDRPFCLYVNFFEPHMPYFGPRDGQYDPAGVSLPPNFGGDMDVNPTLKARLLREHYFRHGHSGLPLRTEADWRRMIANYWGLCSLVDTHAGAILDTLAACGLDERTIVVFTSDHGDMMGSHGLLAKCLPYEEDARVPLTFRLPGQETGRRVRGPVSHVDVVPTLLDLMGVDRPGHLQGISQRAALETGEARVPHGGVAMEWNGPNNGLGVDVVDRLDLPDWMLEHGDRAALAAAFTAPSRTWIGADGWKFTWSAANAHELYDLNTDPGERINRFGESGQSARVRDLADAIRAWQARTGDPAALPAL